MEFKAVWNGSYGPASLAVHKLNKKGIPAYISVGECYTDILTPEQVGKTITTLIFSLVPDNYWAIYSRENSNQNWRQI